MARDKQAVWQELPTTMESAARLKALPAFKRVAGDYDDAVVVRMFDKKPVRTPNMSDRQFARELESWEYRQNNPELYMEFRNFPDQITFLETDMGNISLKTESALTGRDNKWEAARIEVIDDINKVHHNIRVNYDQAMSFMENGVGTIFGVGLTDEGFTFSPLDAEFRKERAQQLSRMTTLGVGAIKDADPSGRLTDQDIKIGKEMAGQIVQGLRSGTNMTWDTIQGLYGKITGNYKASQTEIRRSIGLFFAAAAHYQGLSVSARASQHVVYDHRSTRQFKEDGKEMERWLMRSVKK